MDWSKFLHGFSKFLHEFVVPLASFLTVVEKKNDHDFIKTPILAVKRDCPL